MKVLNSSMPRVIIQRCHNKEVITLGWKTSQKWLQVVSYWMSKLLVSCPVCTSKRLQYGHCVFSTAYAHSK